MDAEKPREVHLDFISASSKMIQTYLLTRKIPIVELLLYSILRSSLKAKAFTELLAIEKYNASQNLATGCS